MGVMYCTDCGFRHADGARFCPECGAAIAAPPQWPANWPPLRPPFLRPPYAQQAQPGWGLPFFGFPGFVFFMMSAS